MQLNHGKFMDNGGCGYLLKPQFLLSSKYLLYTNIFRTTAVMKAETDIITSIAESKGIPVNPLPFCGSFPHGLGLLHGRH
jgi:hypothetical protein